MDDLIVGLFGLFFIFDVDDHSAGIRFVEYLGRNNFLDDRETDLFCNNSGLFVAGGQPRRQNVKAVGLQNPDTFKFSNMVPAGRKTVRNDAGRPFPVMGEFEFGELLPIQPFGVSIQRPERLCRVFGEI